MLHADVLHVQAAAIGAGPVALHQLPCCAAQGVHQQASSSLQLQVGGGFGMIEGEGNLQLIWASRATKVVQVVYKTLLQPQKEGEVCWYSECLLLL